MEIRVARGSLDIGRNANRVGFCTGVTERVLNLTGVRCWTVRSGNQKNFAE